MMATVKMAAFVIAVGVAAGAVAVGAESGSAAPADPEDKPVEFELPQLQITHIDANITVPSGKTALLGGQEIAVECEGRGKVDVVLAILVKPVIIIGDAPPAVPLKEMEHR